MFRFVCFTIIALVWVGNGICATINNSRDYRIPHIVECYTLAAVTLIIGIVGLAK